MNGTGTGEKISSGDTRRRYMVVCMRNPAATGSGLRAMNISFGVCRRAFSAVRGPCVQRVLWPRRVCTAAADARSLSGSETLESQDGSQDYKAKWPNGSSAAPGRDVEEVGTSQRRNRSASVSYGGNHVPLPKSRPVVVR